jgi:hypothetical protein
LKEAFFFNLSFESLLTGDLFSEAGLVENRASIFSLDGVMSPVNTPPSSCFIFNYIKEN